jgi:hypothetical protein
VVWCQCVLTVWYGVVRRCGVVSADPLALVSLPGEVGGYDEEGAIGDQTYQYVSGVIVDEIPVFRNGNTSLTPKSPPVPPRPAPRAHGLDATPKAVDATPKDATPKDATPKAVDRAQEPRNRRAQDGHGLIDEDLASTPARHPGVIQVQGLQMHMEVRSGSALSACMPPSALCAVG